MGTAHFPRMQFVVTQARAMESVETSLFGIAVERPDLAGLTVQQNLHRLPMPYAIRKRTYPLAPWSIGLALKRWRPDVVNLHFLALGGFAAAAVPKVPLITTVHAVEPFLTMSPKTSRERFLKRDCHQALASSSELLAVSDYVADWLRSLGVEADRIVTQYLGVDTEYWHTSTTPGSRLEQQRVVFVGHLTDLKGIRDVLDISRAITASTPHRLDIVGDGPLREHVESVAASHPHIHVHGTASRDAVRSIMEQATVLVLPTQPQAGIEDAAPTVLAEAQSMGVPVVTYAVGGTREMIATPDCAVPVGDRDTMAENLRNLLASSSAVYAERSKAARTWTVEHRDVRACAVQTRARLVRACR